MVDRSGVFVLQSDDSLVSMPPARFATEDDFQRLLSRFPALLVGDQIDPENPRRWTLVRREQTISTDEIGAAQWSVDHLFLDQDGIPTLVEIKRQSDSRIRREVVGQMLDYAANCIKYWSTDTLQASFEKTCEARGASVEATLAELIGQDQEPAEFWTRVKTNLLAGRIRMLFVAARREARAALRTGHGQHAGRASVRPVAPVGEHVAADLVDAARAGERHGDVELLADHLDGGAHADLAAGAEPV